MRQLVHITQRIHNVITKHRFAENLVMKVSVAKNCDAGRNPAHPNLKGG